MSAIRDSLVGQGLLPAGGNSREITLDGEQYLWIDADTVQHKETGESLRLRDLGARETVKVSPDGEVKDGQIGGQEQTDAISKLASEGGFNSVKVVREGDDNRRATVDLVNADGETLSDRATASGVIGITGYTTQEQAAAETFNNLARLARETNGDATEWDAVAKMFEGVTILENGFLKDRAPDERYVGGQGSPYYGKISGHTVRTHADTQFRRFDRSIDNQALSPLSTAWDSGWTGVKENGWGMVELIGNKIGWEGLEDYAEGAKLGAQRDLAEQGEILQSYKDVDDIGDFVEYIGNMAALSLPYMAITAGGALLAPATGGLSLSAPAAVYAGQVWNEMGDTDEKDKSASLAITAGIGMAVLDRLGIAGIANTSVLSAAGRKEIIGELVKKGATQEVAEQQLLNATRLEAAKFMGDAATFAGRQLEAANIGRALLAQVAKGAAVEGTTEVAQETLGFFAAWQGSGDDWGSGNWTWESYTDRITEAAIAGSTLGAGFSVPATAFDAGQWADVALRQAPADLTKRSREQHHADALLERDGYIPTNLENAADAKVRATTTTTDLQGRKNRHKQDRRSFGEVVSDFPGLWRGANRFTLRDAVQDVSEAARKLAGLTDGSLYKIYNGESFETAKHLKLAKLKNFLKTPFQYEQMFGHKQGLINSKEASRKTSRDIYGAYEVLSGLPNNRTKNGNLNWDALLEHGYTREQVARLKSVDRDFRTFTDEVYKERKANDPEVGYVEDYAYRYRASDKAKIEANQQQHVQDLIKHFGVSREVAQDITDRMIYSADNYDVISTHGNFRPGSHKGRTLNLSDNKEYADKYMSNDIFHNLSSMAKATARHSAYNQYVGQDNEVVAQLIDDIENDLLNAGWAPDDAQRETDRIASRMIDYFDAESGNFNRPTTDFGRRLQAWQRQIMLWTTIAGLPLATLSSLPEIFLIFRSNNETKIISELDKFAREGAEALHNIVMDKDFESEGRQHLRNLGYFEWEVGAATVTGATEHTNKAKTFIDKFFRGIGLKQWTDYTRAVRASMAGDYVLNKLEILAEPTDQKTNEQLEAEDALRNLGLNVPRVLATYNAGEVNSKTYDAALDETLFTDSKPYTDTEFNEVMDTAIFNFVNDAIVLPRAANRPLFYNDPRFALFTQFNGFISAFTAEILPKMYNDFWQGKTPSMKYNAFAIMMTMLMMGFMSQYLKDLMKYGKATPHLDTPDKVRRAINSSGLLGVFERPLDIIDPLYEERSDNTLDWAFDTFTGESPALSTVGRAVGVVDAAVSGEGERFVKRAGKITPLVGPFTGLHKGVADWTFGD